MTTKLCVHCAEDKPVGMFSLSPSKSGYASWCKACTRDVQRERRGGLHPRAALPLTKICPRCNVEFVRTGKDGYCPPCSAIARKEWYHDNKRRAQSTMMVWNYGVTLDEYDAILALQNGVCAICGLYRSDGRRMPLDHDHTTNEVRGILCSVCNRGIGAFQDNPETLQAAINYLANYRRG